MAALPTIAETIEIGDVSIYLSGNDNSRGSLFGNRLANPTSNVLIAIVTDAISPVMVTSKLNIYTGTRFSIAQLDIPNSLF